MVENELINFNEKFVQRKYLDIKNHIDIFNEYSNCSNYFGVKFMTGRFFFVLLNELNIQINNIISIVPILSYYLKNLNYQYYLTSFAMDAAKLLLLYNTYRHNENNYARATDYAEQIESNILKILDGDYKNEEFVNIINKFDTVIKNEAWHDLSYNQKLDLYITAEVNGLEEIVNHDYSYWKTIGLLFLTLNTAYALNTAYDISNIVKDSNFVYKGKMSLSDACLTSLSIISFFGAFSLLSSLSFQSRISNIMSDSYIEWIQFQPYSMHELAESLNNHTLYDMSKEEFEDIESQIIHQEMLPLEEKYGLIDSYYILGVDFYNIDYYGNMSSMFSFLYETAI